MLIRTLHHHLTQLAQALDTDFLFPHVCPYCLTPQGNERKEGQPCPECEESLRLRSLKQDAILNLPSPDLVFCAAWYHPPLPRALRQLKFQGMIERAPGLARMGEHLIKAVQAQLDQGQQPWLMSLGHLIWRQHPPYGAQGLWPVSSSGRLRDIDCVVPVPLHPKRQRLRGYNQAEALSRPLAHALTLPHRPEALTRVKSTQRQTELKGIQARETNLRGAFQAQAVLADQVVLVIDDILTTGATLLEAMRAVRAVGGIPIGLVWASNHAGHPCLIEPSDRVS